MLDLLHLVLEDEGESRPAGSHADEQPPLQQNKENESGPSAAQLDSPQSPPPNLARTSKGNGLLAKYKTLVKRRKSSSEAGQELANCRRSSSGAESLEEYAPLGRGESTANAGHVSERDFERVSTSGRSLASPPKQPTTFMEKMRAYRSKKSKSSRSYELPEQAGPLAQGLQQDWRANDSPEEGQESHLDQAKAELEEFFAGVSEAKALLADITARQQQVCASREQSRTLVKPSELKEAQQEIQDEIEEVTILCKKVKVKLDHLDTINAQLLDDEQDEEVPDDAGLQLRLSVMAGLNAKLGEVTKSWQNMRVTWQEEDREEVARQLHTVTGREFAAEDVDDMVQNGGAERIYRQALINAHGTSVQQLMSDVQQRHDQMRQLEASMLELHQVFLDMSILVADQGDTINSIDNWVSRTGETMRESLVQLRQAKRNRRKAAQTKAITFVTGVGLVAGGAGLTATGVGAVAGVPMIIAGAAAVGGSAIGGIK